MSEIQEHLLRMGALALVMMTVAATFFTRRIVEGIWPHLKKSESLIKGDESGESPRVRTLTYDNPMARWWNEAILYAVPLVYGFAWSFVDLEFLYGKIEGYGGRLFFALSLAWASTFLWKVIKKAVPKLFGVTVESPVSDRDLPPEI